MSTPETTTAGVPGGGAETKKMWKDQAEGPGGHVQELVGEEI